jgi:hypothetical protein
MALIDCWEMMTLGTFMSRKPLGPPTYFSLNMSQVLGPGKEGAMVSLSEVFASEERDAAVVVRVIQVLRQAIISYIPTVVSS